MLSKNVNNKKCATKIVIPQWKKKMRKIPVIFDVANWLGHLPITPILKIQ